MPYKLYYRLKTDELFNVRVIYYVEGLLHFCLYAILAASIARIFSLNGKFKIALMILAFIIASLFGWINEFLQLSNPPRGFEWSDILINSLGALFGVGLYTIWHKKRYPQLIEKEQ